MPVYDSVEQLIGHTPLLSLNRLAQALSLRGRVLAKLEACNPAGSVKDRAALSMIEDAERAGALSPGGTIIEPTSGNTGIGLCMMAAVRGYQAVIVMPDTMSVERRLLMQAYGAQVVLTPGAQGMAGAIEKAQALHQALPGSIVAGQFDNPANAQAHYQTTGPEIWQDTQGQVDCVIAGVGTGGTITGVGRYLKEQKPTIEMVAVEPDASAVLSGQRAGAHGLQGIGAGFVPGVLDTRVLDRVMRVTEEEAYQSARLLAQKEGVLCGISGGAALHAALQLSKQAAYAQKTLVVILPDAGERYLSTPLYRE